MGRYDRVCYDSEAGARRRCERCLTVTADKLIILYVDDEVELCKLFRMTFESDKNQIQTFSDPELALEYLKENEVSIIFCDFRMPRMDALEFYESMPERSRQNTPFYIVTGLTSAANLEDPTFADGMLSKPVDSAEIRKILEGLS